MRRLIIMTFGFLLLINAPVSNATCRYFSCYSDETGGNMSCIEDCSGGNCSSSTYFAENCGVVCDRMSGGGCWCEPRGVCYDI